jgi:hypothetical protein
MTVAEVVDRASRPARAPLTRLPTSVAVGRRPRRDRAQR